MKNYNKVRYEKKGHYECDYPGGAFYYLNNKYYRTDGSAVEYFDGTKEWWINGERHRSDGPALECYDGSKYWCQNGKYHREDGPAVIYADGRLLWYYYGEEVNVSSQEEFDRHIKHMILN